MSLFKGRVPGRRSKDRFWKTFSLVVGSAHPTVAKFAGLVPLALYPIYENPDF
jgi:hypothetical protein